MKRTPRFQDKLREMLAEECSEANSEANVASAKQRVPRRRRHLRGVSVPSRYVTDSCKPSTLNYDWDNELNDSKFDGRQRLPSLNRERGAGVLVAESEPADKTFDSKNPVNVYAPYLAKSNDAPKTNKHGGRKKKPWDESNINNCNMRCHADLPSLNTFMFRGKRDARKEEADIAWMIGMQTNKHNQKHLNNHWLKYVIAMNPRDFFWPADWWRSYRYDSGRFPCPKYD